MLFKITSKEKESQKPKDPSCKVSNYINQHQILANNANELDRLPNEGEVFDVISLQSFNAFSLITWALQFTEIQKLYISSYSMSRIVSDALFRLNKEGKIKEIHLFISDSMKHRNPLVVDNLKSQAKDNSAVKVVFGWNHTKIALMETVDQRFLIFTGSGNFSKNARYENYILRQSEQLFRFYEEWFSNAIIK